MKSLVAFLSLVSFMSSSFAFSMNEDLKSIESLSLKSVEKKIEVHHYPGMMQTMNIKVYGTAVFGNSCVVPDEIVSNTKYDNGGNIKITVHSVVSNRACPMVYRPVEKKFLIKTVGTTDIMPIIEVNGAEVL